MGPSSKNGPMGKQHPKSIRFSAFAGGRFQRTYALPIPTLGGPTLWGDILLTGDYRMQQHTLTRHCRILDRKDRRVFWGDYEECMEEITSHNVTRPLGERGKHLVLCLHGIFRAKGAMKPMEEAFSASGYNAWAINYPSTLRSIPDHARQITNILDHCVGVDHVSFVCHSMGGLVARAVLEDRNAPWRAQITPHRLVMIGTPNQGAFVARELQKRTRFFRVLAGPSSLELTPEWVNQLAIPDIPFGIIAGGTGTNMGFNPFLPGDNDMTVTVASAQLKGAADVMHCRAIHTFIMQNPKVLDASLQFIHTGSFSSPSSL